MEPCFFESGIIYLESFTFGSLTQGFRDSRFDTSQMQKLVEFTNTTTAKGPITGEIG